MSLVSDLHALLWLNSGVWIECLECSDAWSGQSGGLLWSVLASAVILLSFHCNVSLTGC